MIRAAAVCLCVFAGGAVAYAAQDVVIMTNGDKLVGEIKKVEKDVLTFETDYSDVDFKIKWEKIASIESARYFVVETFDGKRLSGSLKPGPGEEGNRAGRRHQRTVAAAIGGAADRADVLVAVRIGFGLRLQPDSHQLGETALARHEPRLSRLRITSISSSPTSSAARRRTRPIRSGGTLRTTFADFSAAAGTSTPPRTS
jgi:hypothetical protein